MKTTLALILALVAGPALAQSTVYPTMDTAGTTRNVYLNQNAFPGYTIGSVNTGTGQFAPSNGATVSSVGATFTGGLISVTGSPVTGAGTLAFTVAGTSGAIPCFTSASGWSASSVLAANAIIVGGGAGVCPSTVTTGAGVLAVLANAPTGTGSLVAATSPTITSPTITGAFTATGLVTNADLANSATTVNGQTCTLGAACTVTAAATNVTVGTTTITSGTDKGLIYDNAGVVGNLATANNGVMVTSGTGAPSISTALPNGITATTQSATDNSTKVATTAYVQAQSIAVNPINYGAIPNDNTKAAVNATAFANAMAAGSVLYCPPGQTFYTQPIVVSATTSRIFGSCTLIAAGTYGGGVPVLSITSNTNKITVEDVIISLPGPTYNGNDGVDVFTTLGATIRNVSVTGGRFQLVGSNSNTLKFDHNKLTATTATAIFCTLCYQSSITNNVIDGQYVVGASNLIGVAGGNQMSIIGNAVSNSTGFGINLAASASNFTVSANTLAGTTIECINVENVQLGSITGNTCVFDAHSADFGISLYGAPAQTPAEIVNDVVVSGNSIYGPCKSGIAVADIVIRSSVVGNHIFQPNSCNGSTQDYKSGVLVYGQASQIKVAENDVYDPAGHMAWQIGEGTFVDGTGTPDYNYLSGMAGDVGTSGQISAVGTHTQVFNTNGVWVTWSPVLSCASGTTTTQSATGRYKQLGKTVQVEIVATLTTAGTCASALLVSMPFTSGSVTQLVGQELFTTGAAISVSLGNAAAIATIRKYDNSNIFTNGSIFAITGTYERQ